MITEYRARQAAKQAAARTAAILADVKSHRLDQPEWRNTYYDAIRRERIANA